MSYNVYHQFAFDVPTRTVRYRFSEKGWHEQGEYVVSEEETHESAKELGVTADEAFLYRNVIYFLGAGEVRNSVSARIRRGLAAAKERLNALDPDARAESWDFMSGSYTVEPHVVRGVVQAFTEAHARREPRDEHVVVIADHVYQYKAPSRGGRAHVASNLRQAKRYPNAFEARAAIAADLHAGRRGRREAVPVRVLTQNPTPEELDRLLAS